MATLTDLQNTLSDAVVANTKMAANLDTNTTVLATLSSAIDALKSNQLPQDLVDQAVAVTKQTQNNANLLDTQTATIKGLADKVNNTTVNTASVVTTA